MRPLAERLMCSTGVRELDCHSSKTRVRISLGRQIKLMLMTTKEELLKFGTYPAIKSVDPEFAEKIVPTAIYVWRGRLVAIEWFAEDYGHFIDDENIASMGHRIAI